MSSTMTLDDIDEPLTQHAQQLKSLLIENKSNSEQLFSSVRNHIASLLANPPATATATASSNANYKAAAQALLHILENRTGRGNTQLRAILRTSFSLVASIDTSSTLRDVLGIIVEKIVDSFASLGLRSEDMVLFYDTVGAEAAIMLADQLPDPAPSIQALNRTLTGTKLLGHRLFRQKPSLFGPLNKIRPT
ncbi:hypothetical protein LPJ57_008058 [Coemansia sp. RSA 486]|nr:hypothetical protein LPJ57_008058 [Coemansia sp. RSA 486]